MTEVVNLEPSQQRSNPAFQKKYNDQGEEIVFEGVCHKPGVCSEVFWIYFYASVVSLLGMLILIPIGIFCGLKAMKDWKLYLTRSSVVYIRPRGIGCCDEKYTIPFSDIDDISVAPGTRDIWVRMETSKINEYIGWWSRPMCGQLVALVLSNVANGEEFVAAVKREMQGN